MKLLCLSDLHLRSEVVVAAIDRQRLSVDEFLGHVDRLQQIDGDIVEWYDEENEMAWELNRVAAAKPIDSHKFDEDLRVFLRKLLAQSNADLDFMRIEFY